MHIYELNGNKYPSVTTIIHCLGSDDLMKWANHIGFRHIDYTSEMERTSSFGTILHSHLSAIVDPSHADPIPARNPIEEGSLDNVLTLFKSKLSLYEYKTIYSEKTLISPKLGYAGTLDWLAYLNGKLFLNDFKSSRRPQLHMYLQLGGYYNLLVDDNSDLVKDLAGACIITVNYRGTMFYPISIDLLKRYSEAFNMLARFYTAYHSIEHQYSPELLENQQSGKLIT